MPSRHTAGDEGFNRVLTLMELASGDEKHDPSAESILDIVWVLYDRILRFDPLAPRREDRDRFILSKGHGPLALYGHGFGTPEQHDAHIGLTPEGIRGRIEAFLGDTATDSRRPPLVRAAAVPS